MLFERFEIALVVGAGKAAERRRDEGMHVIERGVLTEVQHGA